MGLIQTADQLRFSYQAVLEGCKGLNLISRGKANGQNNHLPEKGEHRDKHLRLDGDLRRSSSHSTDKSFESDDSEDDEDRPIFTDYPHHLSSEQHLNYTNPEINSELSSTLPPLPPRMKRSVSRSSPDSELLSSASSAKKDKPDSLTSTSTLSAISHSSLSSVRMNSPAATSSTISSSQANNSAGTNDHDDNLHHHSDVNETHPCPPYAPCCSEGDGGGSPVSRLRQRREERIKKTQETINRIKNEMKKAEERDREGTRKRNRAIQRLKKWGLIAVGLALLVGASYAICSNFFPQDVNVDQVLVDKRTAGS